MIVSFQTADLRNCCCKADVAEKKLGTTHAEALGSVISEAEASETAEDFIELYKPEDVDQGDSLLVTIGAGYQARFVAAGQAFSRVGEGATDWSTVRRVKLVELEPAK
jgi:hypothetical protein